MSADALRRASDRGVERLHAALERLEVLCDPGRCDLLRTEVLSRRMGEQARPGDGVLGATGRVDGRPVACYAQDAAFAGGSLGEAHARDDRRACSSWPSARACR